MLSLRETINDIWFFSTDIYDDKFEETGLKKGIFLDDQNIIKVICVKFSFSFVSKWFLYTILFHSESVATSRQGSSSCLLRSCDQMVTGRRLRYGRALAIIQAEEYLDAVTYHRGIQIPEY